MRHLNHDVDLCIVGGGLSGTCAAIAAARHGSKVVLMHDRPVLGGNASSEIRMWVCGAHGENNKETGIIEEIQLENSYRNPNGNFSIWDSVLYEKVMLEENITLLLNCSCNDAEVEGNKIKSIKGWQLTSETWHTVTARYFADCSGDSILAPLTGAQFRMGREGRDEFNEPIAPIVADNKTMGMSCLIQLRETDRPQKFIAPKWANKYTSEDDLPYKSHNLNNNFWWIELGGEGDTLHDAEELRHELLKIAFGVWDHMKNYGDHDVDNWILEWVGFLPGKRESRRYIGDYILTQHDVESEGHFDDLVAYGGWSMDDHYPAGFHHKESYPTIFHPAPSPYGIPYRCLYSKNIDNLFFAGRNISATHTALSSTRVMGTCCLLGQAVGTAASIAARENVSPRDIYNNYLADLKETLMEDDCYLPWNKKSISDILKTATIKSSCKNANMLMNGLDRVIGEDANAINCVEGDYVDFEFDKTQTVNEIRIVFDSDLNNYKRMPCKFSLNDDLYAVPSTIVKEYQIYAKADDGKWLPLIEVDNNYQRLAVHKIGKQTNGIRIKFNKSWGAKEFRVFSIYIK